MESFALMPEKNTLKFRSVNKRFGGTLAVNDVSFDVHDGEILALLGENGAGKSTLIKMLAGVYTIDAGNIEINGQPVYSYSQGNDAGRSSVAFVHQDLGLIEWMTVTENICLGGQLTQRWSLINWKSLRRRAREALERVGGGIDPEARIFDLSRTEKSLVAIARAVIKKCTFLVLDEPTSSLPEADVKRFFEVLEGLRDRGVGMIYVSHRLDEIRRIADRVVVMRNGRLVGNRKIEETNTDELVTMIVGRSITDVFGKTTSSPSSRALLELQNLCVDGVGPVSLHLYAGEILALTGLKGSGYMEVGRTMFGLKPGFAGTIKINDIQVDLKSVPMAISHGIGFTSSDRHEEGLAETLSVRENLFLNPAILGQPLVAPLWPNDERRQGRELVKIFNIRPAVVDPPISTLSGGNQQKVILTRWIHCGPKVLILEEPTLGVDVGSKAEIYTILKKVLGSGKAIILVSSDFEEVANIAHRAHIFYYGRQLTELAGQNLTVPRLVQSASGERHPANEPINL